MGPPGFFPFPIQEPAGENIVAVRESIRFYDHFLPHRPFDGERSAVDFRAHRFDDHPFFSVFHFHD